MARELVLCEGCKRHVFAGETACPFCHASMSSGGRGLAAVVALSAGLSLAGCTREQGDVYGSPPPARSSASSPNPPATVSGAPPVVATSPPAPPDAPNTSAKPPASATPPASAKPPAPLAKPPDRAIPAYGLPPRKPPPGSGF
jgi:hypothetical protein